MKKAMLLGAALLLVSVAAWAVSLTVTETSSAGTTIVVSRGVTLLDSVFIGDVAGVGAFTISVYDSGVGATTASLKRYTILVPDNLTTTSSLRDRVIQLGGQFFNGITVSTDGFINTVTASWHTSFVRSN